MTNFLEVFTRLREAGFIPGAIIDGGAHIGAYATQVAALWPSARVLLVDPLSSTRDTLAQLAARQEWDFAPVGLGMQAAGAVHFNEHGPQSSLLPNFAGQTWGETATVELESLNHLVRAYALPAPYLLKLDIQGAELDALRGATWILGETPVIHLEVSFVRFQDGLPLAHEVIAWLGGRGYLLYDFFEFSRRPDGSLLQADIVFVSAASGLVEHQWVPGEERPWS